MTRSELKRLSRCTSLVGIEEIIFPYFLRPQVKRINIMELLAAIITFSYMEWEEKIIFALRIFDFDGSKDLTVDEFFIMAKCFIVGISTMTGGKPVENEVIIFFSQSLYMNQTELTVNE